MNLNSTFDADGLLASRAELVGILARLATPANRHCARKEALLAQEAISRLFSGNTPPVRVEPPAATIAVLQAPRGTQRTRCACGRCKQCVDNARWERIFNEKYADPSYYGTLEVRQGSSLAGAR